MERDRGRERSRFAPSGALETGGSHLQATTEEERIVDRTQDLREIRRMVEFLVRRERKLDVKADVAVRRLEKLEKEHSQLEHEASPPDDLAERTKVVKLVVDKWFVDKGFGSGKVPTSGVVFVHASVVRGAEVLTIGTDAWCRLCQRKAEDGTGGLQLPKTTGMGEKMGITSPRPIAVSCHAPRYYGYAHSS